MKMEATASCSSWLENLAESYSDRTRAIEELTKGREMALQLRDLIHKFKKNDGSSSSELTINQDLVANILSSFTNSLSMLKNDDSADEVSQVVQGHTNNNTHQFSSPPACLKPEDSGESSRSSTIIIKDRRGCYKRRKGAETWTQNSSTLVDDGYAWRKYGQKGILRAKFPRNYFRCTHKIDQGCQATKQVQRIQEEPPEYRTTYYGHHTCNLIKPSEYDHHHQLIMLDSTTDHDHRCSMISFDGSGTHTHITGKEFNTFLTSSLPPIKQGNSTVINKDHDDHQAPLSDMTHNQCSSTTNEYLVSPAEFTTFDSNGNMTVLSSQSDDHGKSSTSFTATATAHSSCLDMGVDMPLNFDYDFLDFLSSNY